MQDVIPEGRILPDSETGRVLGFTSDKFSGYLWKHGKYVYISFIISKQPSKGHFKQLVDRILELGYGVKIPTPLGIMESIVRKWGFRKTWEYVEEVDEEVEVWVKDPK